MNKLNLRQMLNVQDQLNENTIPNWKMRLTMDDFNMAIMDESAELIGSGRQWAWWKKQGPIDEWNEKIEIVDLLHFFLAKIILEGIDPYIVYVENGEAVTEEDFFFGENATPKAIVGPDGSFNTRQAIEIHQALLDNEYLGGDGIKAMNQLIVGFGMDAEEISAIYTLKSTLNFIRQEGGYKDGNYQKVLNGRQDNELLEDLFSDFMDRIDGGKRHGTPIPTLDDLKKETRVLFGV